MSGKEFFEEGQQLFMAGKVKGSIEKFNQALESGYDEIPLYLSRGAAYINLQDYDRALADLDKALAREPENERAHYYRGIILLNKEDYSKAIEDFNESIKQNPDRGPAFLGRGLALAELGQEDEAMDNFKTAVAHSTVEVERFTHGFENARTKFGRSMALLEGDRGPLSQVLSPEEVEKLQRWLEPER